MSCKMIKSCYNHDVFVGAETGLLKGINTGNNSWTNLNCIENVAREKEIVSLCWDNNEQTELCAGLRNQSVVIYDTSAPDVTRTLDLSAGVDGQLISIAKTDGDYISCTESGSLRLWTNDCRQKVTIDVGANVCCMKNHAQHRHLVATGGKENELKIWDLNSPDKAVFAAKNVRHDWLNLRVPVWIRKIDFIPDSEKVVTSTNNHLVRLYDPSTTQRRPVLEFSFDEYPITALSVRQNGHQAVIGNTHGNMAMIDLRSKGIIVQQYKGVAGGIRAIQCHPSVDTVASCGLDRFVRIHDVNSKHVLHKFYVKSRLNCLLLKDSSPAEAPLVPKDEPVEVMVVDDVGASDEELWSTMGTVETRRVKRKTKSQTARELKQSENVALKAVPVVIEKKRKRKPIKKPSKKKKVPTATLR